MMEYGTKQRRKFGCDSYQVMVYVYYMRSSGLIFSPSERFLVRHQDLPTTGFRFLCTERPQEEERTA